MSFSELVHGETTSSTSMEINSDSESNTVNLNMRDATTREPIAGATMTITLETLRGIIASLETARLALEDCEHGR